MKAPDPEIILKQFLGGQIAPKEFEQLLYGELERFEAYLNNDPNLSSSNYVQGSVFQFILQCDFKKLSGVLNAQGALADYFERNDIPFTRDPSASDLYGMMLEVQPRYVGVEVDWLVEYYSKRPEWADKEGRREWLRRQICEDFRFLTKPPHWIQDPAWIIGPDGPYVFMGQIEVEKFFHDAAAIYVFYNPATGHSENVIQVM